MNLRTIEERLRREHDLPDDFVFWAWECFPSGSLTLYVEFRGGQCPRIMRGRRAGRPNYRKVANKRVFNVPVTDADRWEDDYERDTGKCRQCRGSRQELSKINFVTDTTEYRTCSQCKGSGKMRPGNSTNQGGLNHEHENRVGG